MFPEQLSRFRQSELHSLGGDIQAFAAAHPARAAFAEAHPGGDIQPIAAAHPAQARTEPAAGMESGGASLWEAPMAELCPWER
jgi:hypothetical protein